MKKNLDIRKPFFANKFCQSVGPSLNGSSIVHNLVLHSIILLLFFLYSLNVLRNIIFFIYLRCVNNYIQEFQSNNYYHYFSLYEAIFDEDITHTHLQRGWPVGIKSKWIILFWWHHIQKYHTLVKKSLFSFKSNQHTWKTHDQQSIGKRRGDHGMYTLTWC